MRWCVMQSMKYRKWILTVMSEDFTEYEVTDIMSDDVWRVVQYADYLNGKIPENIIKDKSMLSTLDSVKERYSRNR